LKAEFSAEIFRNIGAPDRIRTCDLWNRNPTLYPAELRVHPMAMNRLSDEGFLAQVGAGFNREIGEKAI
jgi:hypothetical protein